MRMNQKLVNYNMGYPSDDLKRRKKLEELNKARRELEEMVDFRMAENSRGYLADSEEIVKKSQQVDRLLNDLYTYTSVKPDKKKSTSHIECK